MVNSNETSIQVIRNKGILSKLINFVRKLFGKNNSNYFSITKEEKFMSENATREPISAKESSR